MNGGSSVGDESIPNGNVIATSTTQHGDGAAHVHATANTTAKDDESATEIQDDTVPDESKQNIDSAECQRSIGEDKETQLDGVGSALLHPQERKQRVSSRSTQPGAIAVAGVDEGNHSDLGSHENVNFCSIKHHDEVISATATVAIGMDQGDTVSDAMLPSLVEKDVDAMDRQLNHDVRRDNNESFPDFHEGDACDGMIEAELVIPPIEAVRVSIDEDPTTTLNYVHPFELENSQSRDHTDDTRSKKFGPVFFVLLSLLIVIVLCATLIPYTLRTALSSQDRSTSPTPSPPNSCYTRLLDILIAQVSDEDIEAPIYVICPNTKISVGTLNSVGTNVYTYVSGDYPILVTRENVTIQCGWDGRLDNNCVIDAGFMHVLTLQVIGMADGSLFTLNRTNDNLLIRGITFTGIPVNVGPFLGISISLSHPGRNMRFEDCLWYNMTAESGLIGAYRNYYQASEDLPLEDRSIEVTFADCIFQNVIFGSALIFARNQAIKLERCIFRDIHVSFLAEDDCQYPSGASDNVAKTDQGCPSLLECSPNSYCSMKDLCMYGIDTWGHGIVVIRDETTFHFEGIYLEPDSTDATCDLAILSTPDDANFSCSEIFVEPSCPLLP